MKNIEALKSLCNAIASSFYPDEPTMRLMLMNEDMDGNDYASQKDATLLKIAVKLVMGYVEIGRNEQGISVSVDRDQVVRNIRMWCVDYGLDADDILSDYVRVISNGTNLW